MNSNASLIRVGTPTEGSLQASKWLQIQILFETDELRDLFEDLGDFYICLANCVTPKNHGTISKEEFLGQYQNYIDLLKKGETSNMSPFRKMFSSIFTTSLECLYTIPLENDQQLIRVATPVIQLQPHQLDYSPQDLKFRPMILGLDSISWGIQFSYPQLYQNIITKEVFTIKENNQFPNTLLFKKIQKWVRKYTIPTPFVVEGKVCNVPMRLGKKCLTWINNHPQLIRKDISVKI